jgi:hypothetical protein
MIFLLPEPPESYLLARFKSFKTQLNITFLSKLSSPKRSHPAGYRALNPHAYAEHFATYWKRSLPDIPSHIGDFNP